MPPRDRNTLTLTGAQAQYVISGLLKDRRITERDVRVSLAELDREIQALEGQLRALREAVGSSASRAAVRAPSAPASASPAGPLKRRRPNLSPARRAALRLQGLYLALMRQIPKTKRASFKALRKAKGMPAALSAMKKSIGN